MSEHQILGVMLALQSILVVVGLFLGLQVHRETKEVLIEARVTAEWQARAMAILERLEQRLGVTR
jgi:hypothetical protein